MARSNETTLETYQARFQAYIDNTAQTTEPGSSQGQWLASALEGLGKDAKIFEIGSAFGRDAHFIQSLGYKVVTSDAFDAAVTYLKEHGFDARKFNVLTDELSGTYDLIIAAAVFLHFSDEELSDVLEKLAKHIAPRGRLAFSVKVGNGEYWESVKLGDERYFRLWQPEELREFLGKQRYDILDERVIEVRGKTWLHFIVRPKG